MFGILKIWYLTSARLAQKCKNILDKAHSFLWKWFFNSLTFTSFTGVNTFQKQKRNRRKSRKKYSKITFDQKKLILALTIIFDTTKSPSEFTDRHNFNIRTIIAIIDNYAMVTILNNNSLFVRKLKWINNYSIVII